MDADRGCAQWQSPGSDGHLFCSHQPGVQDPWGFTEGLWKGLQRDPSEPTGPRGHSDSACRGSLSCPVNGGEPRRHVSDSGLKIWSAQEPSLSLLCSVVRGLTEARDVVLFTSCHLCSLSLEARLPDQRAAELSGAGRKRSPPPPPAFPLALEHYWLRVLASCVSMVTKPNQNAPHHGFLFLQTLPHACGLVSAEKGLYI